MSSKAGTALAAAVARRVLGTAVIPAVLAGCRLFGGQPVPTGGAMEAPAGSSPRAVLDRYARAGMLAAPEPVSFVGAVRTLAGVAPESTLALVMLSFPTRALGFVREGDRYRASYEVSVEFRQAERVLRRITARQTVRVGTFTETIREDDGVLFQEFTHVAPGSYEVAVTVRDSVTGVRGTAAAPLGVPRFGASGVAAPVAVYQGTGRERRDSLPDLVTNPRATVVAERDSALRVYVEGYALAPPAQIGYLVQDERGRDLLRDSVPLVPAAEGAEAGTSPVIGRVITVRTKRLGPGLYWLGSWRSGASDTSWVPFFVFRGEGLASRDRAAPARTNTRLGHADAVSDQPSRAPHDRARRRRLRER